MYNEFMRLFVQLVKLTINQYLIYRLSFVLWRFRVVLNVLIVYFLWASVYSSRATAFGYTQQQMVTYIVLTNIVGTLIFSTRSGDVAGEILEGTVMNYLTKPVSFLKFVFAREVADKLSNGSFALIEALLLVVVFNLNLFFQTAVISYIALLVSFILAGVIAFFISLIISFFAFWTTEVWAPRFIYFVMVFVLAGLYFPLDVLPQNAYRLLLFTPFPYLAFVPIKIYLEGFGLRAIPFLAGAGIWALGSWFFARYLWRKGLREFSFHGR